MLPLVLLQFSPNANTRFGRFGWSGAYCAEIVCPINPLLFHTYLYLHLLVRCAEVLVKICQRLVLNGRGFMLAVLLLVGGSRG